jgi:hypothetical protein
VFLPSVGHQSGQEMHSSVVEATMAPVRDVAHVLEWLAYAFDQRSLAQQELVQQWHQLVFHLALELRDQLHPSLRQPFEQLLTKVATIAGQLTPE